MADNNAPASMREQLVEVSGIPGYFATKTGGEVSADTTVLWDGGRTKPEKKGGPPDTANIVVTKIYRPNVHRVILRNWAKQVSQRRVTIKIHDTDADLGPIGNPLVYANALLVRVQWPEFDASSSDGAKFELEFAVEGLS